MKVGSLFTFATFAAIAAAAEPELVYHVDELQYTSCSTYIAKVATLFGKKDKKKFCNVKNQPALGTMAHCLVEGFGEGASGINYFLKDTCKGKITEEEFKFAYENATDYIVDVKTYDGFNKTKLFSLPVKLSKKQIRNTWLSTYTRFFNYNWSTWFSTALIAYWFFIFIVAGLINLARFIAPGLVQSFTGKTTNLFRKYITLAPTGRQHHIERKRIWGIIEVCVPTRLELIIVFGWFILALVFNIVHIDHVSQNTVWKSKMAEMGRKVSDRSGIMATFLIPIQILFAGRNNFLQWVSGFSYLRMIVFHRWVSRIVFALVIMHTVAMSASGVALGKFVTRNKKAYVQWGYVATVGGLIMLVTAAAQFRRTNYELFLGIHIVLAVFWIAGGWLHTAEQDFQEFYYAATAVWVLDRAVRIARLVAFGVQKATVEIKADEILKVTVPRPKYWKPFPGCHAFIHFLKPTMFWQSHPFTVVDSVTKENTITFYIKIKGGVTHGLYQFLSKQPDHKAQVYATVEGPYGQPMPLSRYSTAVLFAGGNGIPGLYANAVKMAKSSVATKVKLHWVIRHYHSIQWFYDELKKLEGTNAEVTVYVTKPTEGFISDFNTSDGTDEKQEKGEAESFGHEDYVKSIKANLPFVTFVDGRPELERIVKSEIEESPGSIAFVTCAHSTMVDGMRKLVSENLQTTKRVEYFDAIQSW